MTGSMADKVNKPSGRYFLAWMIANISPMMSGGKQIR